MIVCRTGRAAALFDILAAVVCDWYTVHRAQTQNGSLSAIKKIGSRVYFGRGFCSRPEVIWLLVAILLAVSAAASAQEKSPEEIYRARIEQARASYRVAIAKQIRQAKKVEVVLLRFDDLRKIDLFEDFEGRFSVDPYKATTSVISEKALDSSQGKELLLALADQVEKEPVRGDQLLCHLPVHGVRIYSDEPSGEFLDNELIYSGTFSWTCRTFGFTYPDGAEWLDTNSNLKDIFNKLLPIPKEELERLEKKYPTKQRGEQLDEPCPSDKPAKSVGRPGGKDDKGCPIS